MLVVVTPALARPSHKALLALRGLMIPVALGSLVGVWEHVQSNIALYREVHATATMPQIIGAALGGRNPLLAPGMLALAAALAVAATYYHPVRRELIRLSQQWNSQYCLRQLPLS